MEVDTDWPNDRNCPWFKCLSCAKIYRSKHSLYVHCLTNHARDSYASSKTKEGNYLCRTCNKIYKSQSSFRRHNQTHRSNYQCKVCSFYTGSKVDILHHVHGHKEGKSHCMKCGKLYKNKYRLAAHTAVCAAPEPDPSDLYTGPLDSTIQDEDLIINLNTSVKEEPLSNDKGVRDSEMFSEENLDTVQNCNGENTVANDSQDAGESDLGETSTIAEVADIENLKANVGGLDLEIPLDVLNSCPQLGHSDVLVMKGITVAEDGNLVVQEELNIQARKRKETICFSLAESAMSVMFEQKLGIKYRCVVTSGTVIQDVSIDEGKTKTEGKETLLEELNLFSLENVKEKLERGDISMTEHKSQSSNQNEAALNNEIDDDMDIDLELAVKLAQKREIINSGRMADNKCSNIVVIQQPPSSTSIGEALYIDITPQAVNINLVTSKESKEIEPELSKSNKISIEPSESQVAENCHPEQKQEEEQKPQEIDAGKTNAENKEEKDKVDDVTKCFDVFPDGVTLGTDFSDISDDDYNDIAETSSEDEDFIPKRPEISKKTKASTKEIKEEQFTPTRMQLRNKKAPAKLNPRIKKAKKNMSKKKTSQLKKSLATANTEPNKKRDKSKLNKSKPDTAGDRKIKSAKTNKPNLNDSLESDSSQNVDIKSELSETVSDNSRTPNKKVGRRKVSISTLYKKSRLVQVKEEKTITGGKQKSKDRVEEIVFRYKPNEPAEQIVCLLCKKAYAMDRRNYFAQHIGDVHMISLEHYHTLLDIMSEEERQKRINEFLELEIDKKRQYKAMKYGREQNQFYECSSCHMLLSDFPAYRTHIIAVHSKDDDYPDLVNKVEAMRAQKRPNRVTSIPLQCSYCQEEKVGMQALKTHMRLMHCDKPDISEKLNEQKGVARELYLLSRREDYHKKKGDTSISFPCRHCTEVYKYRASRSRHEKYSCVLNPKRIKVHYCTGCDKKFEDVDELKEHRLEHAKQDFQHICHICGHVRSTKAGIYDHMKKVHKTQVPKFACLHCDKKFHDRGGLDLHLSVHTDRRPYQCEVCGNNYKTRAAVIKHQNAVHKNKYAYYCERCGHGVAKKQYLDAHKCGRVRRNQQEGETSTSQIRTPKAKKENKTVIEQFITIPQKPEATEPFVEDEVAAHYLIVADDQASSTFHLEPVQLQHIPAQIGEEVVQHVEDQTDIKPDTSHFVDDFGAPLTVYSHPVASTSTSIPMSVHLYGSQHVAQ